MKPTQSIFSFLVFFGVATLGCRNEDDPQEKISKLRALGVGSLPTIATTGAAAGAVELTIYAAVPKGKTVAFESFADTEAKFSLPQLVKISDATAAYTEYAAFRLFAVKATMVVPPAETLKLQKDQSARLRYGIKLTSDDEEEKVVGDVLVFSQGADQASWKAPSAEIESPGGSVPPGQEVDLKGKITKNQEERIKVGWFVSTGSVKNRRAISTAWESPDAGDQTLILTVRGTESRGFGIQVRDVPVK